MEDHELDPTSIDLDSEDVEKDIGDITTTPLLSQFGGGFAFVTLIRL